MAIFVNCGSPVSMRLKLTGMRVLNNGDVVHTFVTNNNRVYERILRKDVPPDQKPAIWQTLIAGLPQEYVARTQGK